MCVHACVCTRMCVCVYLEIPNVGMDHFDSVEAKIESL